MSAAVAVANRTPHRRTSSAPASHGSPPVAHLRPVPLPVGAAEWALAGLTAEQRRAAGVAQAAWLTRQASLDPRLPAHSRPVTAEEVRAAVRVLRSLYDRAALDAVTLGAAIDWAAVLCAAAEEAAATRTPPALPLPYLWIPKATLDALDRERVDDDDRAAPPRRERARRPHAAPPARADHHHPDRREIVVAAGAQDAQESAPFQPTAFKRPNRQGANRGGRTGRPRQAAAR